MLCNKQTKRNLTVLLTVMAVLASGLALTAWADHKLGHNPGGGKPGGGGGEEPPRYTQVYLYCDARGINDAGQVVGSSGDPPYASLLTPEYDEAGNPVVWFRDDGQGGNLLMLDLGILPGDLLSSALSVNDSGQVVGYSYGNVVGTETWRSHACMWDSTSGMIDLGTLRTLGGDESWSWAYAINGAGQVVGEATTDDYYFRHAFLWEDLNSNGQSDPGEMIDLGTLGGPESEARFINDSGQVVGSADTSVTDNEGWFIERAFLITPEYDSDGNPVVWFRDDNLDGINDLMTDLGTLGGLWSWGAAMNDSGQIAGAGRINSNTNHAFLITPEYDEDGNPVLWFRDSDGDGTNDLMTDLGTLKSLNDSSSGDLNNAGQVVGVSFKGSGGGRPGMGHGVSKPFLWEDGQMKDLNELTDSDIDIGSSIGGINNAGQIVSYSGYILLPIAAAP